MLIFHTYKFQIKKYLAFNFYFDFKNTSQSIPPIITHQLGQFRYRTETAYRKGAAPGTAATQRHGLQGVFTSCISTQGTKAENKDYDHRRVSHGGPWPEQEAAAHEYHQ